jgi:catechol 2,3-dioxygenase-like lactoylglutathione lyase family enzyme
MASNIRSHSRTYSRTGKSSAALLLLMLMRLSLPASMAAQASPVQLVPPELPNPLHLIADHATASVADLHKEEQWYIHVLGFREVNHIHPRRDFEACRVSIPGFSIDLVLQTGSRRSEKGAGNLEQGWLHVVFKTSALDQAYSALTSAHADVKAERDAHGVVSRLIMHDPEGNEIEIFAE